MRNFKAVKFIFVILFLMFCITSCGSKKNIDVKADFEYMYNTIETCFLTLDKGIKTRKINKSLDAIESFVKKEDPNLKAVGERLNSILLTEKESYEIIRYNERYSILANKYLSYFQRNINTTQKDRFVTVVVEGVVKKFMDQLVMPKSSMELLKKAIR